MEEQPTDVVLLLQYQRLHLQSLEEELREVRQELAQTVAAHLVTTNLVAILLSKVEALHQLVATAVAPEQTPKYVGVSLADWPPPVAS